MAVLPLIRKLNVSQGNIIQNWYADDASAVGELELLRSWMLTLIQRGSAYGYSPEPHKSYLVVSPELKEQAEALFANLGISVVTGQHFLSSFVGDDPGKTTFVQRKVNQWCDSRTTRIRGRKTRPQN